MKLSPQKLLINISENCNKILFLTYQKFSHISCFFLEKYSYKDFHPILDTLVKIATNETTYLSKHQKWAVLLCLLMSASLISGQVAKTVFTYIQIM